MFFRNFQLWTSFTWKRWLRSTFGRGTKARRRLSGRPRRPLQLEGLEHRITPAVYTWTGAASGSWNNAANWSGGLPGSQPGVIDLVFPASATTKNTTNDMPAGLVVNSITINATSGAGANYVLGGAGIQLGSNVAGSGSISVGATFTGAGGTQGDIISLPIVLAAPTGVGGSFQQFLTTAAGGTLTISGSVSGTIDSQLVKDGAGTLVLSGNNSTFSGTFSINAGTGGTVVAATATALGDNSNPFIVGTNTQLKISGTGLTFTKDLWLSGFGAAAIDGALLNATGSNEWQGGIFLQNDVYLGAAAGSTLKISGVISDTGSGDNLNKVGPGTIIFTNANTYRLATTIDNGILQAQNSLAFGSSPGSIVTVNFTNTSTGTLQLFDPTATASGPGNGLFFDIPLVLNGPGVASIGALDNRLGDNVWNGPVILGLPSQTIATSVLIGADNYTIPNFPTNLTISGVVQEPPGGGIPLFLNKVGQGRVILTADNTYKGTTTVVAGYLRLQDSNALGPTLATVNFTGDIHNVFDPTTSTIVGEIDNIPAGLLAQLSIGQIVTGPGIPQGTYITAIDPFFQSVTLSVAVVPFNLNLVNQPFTAFGKLNIVDNGASLELAIDSLTDSFTGTSNTLYLNQPVKINGLGVNDGTVPLGGVPGGALHSISGINVWAGPITLNNTPATFLGTLTGGSNVINNVSSVAALYVGEIITGTNIPAGTTVVSVGLTTVTLSASATGSGSFTFQAIPTKDAIGVDPDPSEVASNAYFALEYSLTVSGNNPKIGPAVIDGPSNITLGKLGGGDLILPTANPYLGPTDIAVGWITIGNNNSLGSWNNGIGDTVQTPTTVESGAALMLLPMASFTGNTTAGSNSITSVQITSVMINGLPMQSASPALAVGQPISGPGLPAGTFIQSISGNTITLCDALGNPVNATVTATSDTGPLAFTTTVIGGHLDLAENLILSGTGINHAFSLINQAGALESLNGENLIGANYDPSNYPLANTTNPHSSWIKLNGVVGIGVEDVFSAAPANQNWSASQVWNDPGRTSQNPSELTSIAPIRDADGSPGSIVKLGSRRLDLQGPGTYTGTPSGTGKVTVEVAEGVLRVQNNTALGANNFSAAAALVIVDSGAALELAATNPLTSGGTTGGLFVQNKHLILHGPGNATYSDFPLTNMSIDSPGTYPSGNDIYNFPLAADNRWAGPIDLDSTVTIDVRGSVTDPLGNPFATPIITRLTLSGTIRETTTGSTLTKAGIGELVLSGDNTYTGNTYIGVDPDGTYVLPNGIAGKFTGKVNAAGNTITSVFTGNTGTNLTTVTNVNTTGLFVGEVIDTLSGTGLQPGTTIVAINAAGANTITLSQPATATVTGQSFTTLRGVIIGQTVSGTGIPVGAIVTGINLSLGTLQLDKALAINATPTTFTTRFTNQFAGVTNGTTLVTNVTGITNLSVGQSITDLNNVLIAPGTTITAINVGAGTITLSQAAASSSGAQVTLGTGLPGGTLTIEHPNALGSVPSTVQVANHAALQIQGSIIVHNKTLRLEGNGSPYVPTVTPSWFNLGPAPINNGQTGGSLPVTGRVTGVAVDPSDPNVIYISAGGGGAWKSFDGGKTWQPLIDQAQDVIPGGSSSPNWFIDESNGAAIPIQDMYMGSIAISPVDPRVLYVGIGESNTSPNADNFYGTGVLQSTDSGRTWTLLQPSANGFFGLTIGKIVPDPLISNVIYLTVNDNGVNTPATANVGNIGIWRYDGTQAPATQWANLTVNKVVNDAQPNNIVQQTVTVTGGNNSPATWNLTFNGSTTVGLPFATTTASDVANALNALPSVIALDPTNPISVVLTSTTVGALQTTIVYTVTFGGNFIGVPPNPSQPTAPIGGGPTSPGNGITVNVALAPPVTVNPLSGGISFNQASYKYTDVAVVINPSNNLGFTGTNPDGRLVFFGLTDQGGGSDWFADGSQNIQGANGVYTAFYSPGANNSNSATWYEFSSGSAANAIKWADLLPGTTNHYFTHAGEIKLAVNVSPNTYVSANPATPALWKTTVTVDALISYPTNYGFYMNWPFAPTIRQPDNQFREIGQLKLEYDVTPGDPNKTDGWPRGVLYPPGDSEAPPQWISLGMGGINNDLQGIWPNPISILPPSQGDYDGVITFGPGNPNNLYVFGIGHGAQGGYTTTGGYFSGNGGTSFSDIGIDASGNAPHVDAFASAFDSLGRLLLGTDGGLFRWTGATWESLNGDLSILQVNNVAVDPTLPDNAFAGSMNNGISQYSGANGWNFVLPGPYYSGGNVQFNNQVPTEVWADGDGGHLFKSTDGGATWTLVTVFNNVTTQTPSLFGNLMPFVVDPLNGSRIVLGSASTHLQQSLDDGATWQSLNGPVITTAFGIAGQQGPFIFDPRFPQVADRGSNTPDQKTFYVTNGDTLWLTKDAGITWVNVTANLNAVPTFDGLNPQITQVVVDPLNRDTVYITTSEFGEGHVFMSTNAGQTWKDISVTGQNNVAAGLPDLPTYALVIDPRNGDIFVGNDNGVYQLAGGYSNVNPNSWTLFSTGLPKVSVRQLVLNKTLNTLTAATYGRGVYQLSLEKSTPNAGALVELSGGSTWAGNIQLIGDPVSHNVTIGANGTQVTQDGISNTQLNIVGAISDLTPGSNPTLIINNQPFQQGAITFSGVNSYGGLTLVQNGVLISNNAKALGGGTGFVANNPTIVYPGASLELENDLSSETVFLYGGGYAFNGHNTGAMRAISNNPTFTGTVVIAQAATIGVDSGITLTIGSKAGLSGSGTITDAGTIPVPVVNAAAPPPPAASPSYDLIKELGGTLILQNADTYTGNTLVMQGVLQIQNGQALGNSGMTTTVLDGAQLQLLGGIVVASELLDLSGTGINNTGALQSIGGFNTWAGNVTLDTLQGGSGNGPAPFAPFNIAIGVLPTTASDGLLITGDIGQVGGYLGITKVGGGLLILNPAGAGNNYAGWTDVLAGTLRIQESTALGLGGGLMEPPISTPSGPFFPNQGTQVEGGGTLQLDGSLGALAVAGEDLTLNGSVITGNIVVTTYPATPTTPARTVTTVVVSGGTTGLVPGQFITGPGIPAGTFIASVNGSSTITLSNNAAASVSNATLLLPATVENLAGNNSWSGSVFLQSSTDLPPASLGRDNITVDGTSILTVSGVVQDATAFVGQPVPSSNIITGDVAANSATITNLSTTVGLYVGQTITDASGSLAPNTTIKAMTATSITLSQNPVFSVVNDQLSIWAPDGITPARPLPAADLHKLGTGTLVFPGANSYAGTTFVDAGALQIQNNNSLGTPSYSEIDKVTVTGSTSSWSLTYGGQTTNSISPTATADAVRLALEALPNINPGDVKVTKTNQFFLIMFTNALGGQAQLLTGAGSGSTLVTVQRIQIGGGGGTVVAANAALQLNNPAGLTITEMLNLTGTGINGHGALENVAGSNTITAAPPLTTPFTPTANGPTNATFGMDQGQDTLTINHDVTMTATDGLFVTVDSTSLNGASIFTVVGALNLGGAKLSGQVPNPPGIGTLIPIISATSITAGSKLSQGGVPIAEGGTVTFGGVSFTIHYDYAGTQAGGIGTPAVYLTQAPTPTTLTLVGSAATSVYGQDFTWTATIVPNGGGSPSPSVNGELMTFFVTLPGPTVITVVKPINASGQAVFDAATDLPGWPLDPQIVKISASYPGDSTYGSSSSAQKTQTIVKASTKITLTPTYNPAIIGVQETITATVAPVAPGQGTPTGNVSFTITYTSASGTTTSVSGGHALVGGVATYQFTPSSGSYIITASYGSDIDFKASTSSPLSLIANKAPSQTAVTSSGTAIAGWPVTLTATVTDPFSFGIPTGKVTFSIVQTGAVLGSITLAASGPNQATAQLVTFSIPIGTWTIKASYGGSTAYLGSSGTVAQTISPTGTKPTTVTVSGSTSTVVGQTSNFIATVVDPNALGVPTGYVTFFVDGVAQAPILLGPDVPPFTATANITLTLAAGTHSIFFKYSGDATYAGPKTSNTIHDVVTKPTSQVALTSSTAPNNSVVGAPVTFTATVSPTPADPVGSPTPTGTVTFYNVATGAVMATKTLVGGVASFTTNALPLGTTKVKAVYGGSTTYIGSSAIYSQVVQVAGNGVATDTLNVTPDSNPVVAGTLVTFTADVIGDGVNVPTGWVTFIVDNVNKGQFPVSANGFNAVATYSMTFNAIGAHSVVAKYTGDLRYPAKTKTITETVNKAATTTTVATSGSPSVRLAPVTFTATVAAGSGTPTGTVSFYNNGTLIGTTTLSGGIATIKTNGLTLGSHNIKAIYNGSAAYQASASPIITQDVVSPGPTPSITNLTPSTNTPTLGQSVTFTATVSGSAGTPTGWVIFYVNGVATKPVAVNGAGVATLTIALTGNTNVYAYYTGDPVVYASSKSRTLSFAFSGGSGRLL